MNTIRYKKLTKKREELMYARRREERSSLLTATKKIKKVSKNP